MRFGRCLFGEVREDSVEIIRGLREIDGSPSWAVASDRTLEWVESLGVGAGERGCPVEVAGAPCRAWDNLAELNHGVEDE